MLDLEIFEWRELHSCSHSSFPHENPLRVGGGWIIDNNIYVCVIKCQHLCCSMLFNKKGIGHFFLQVITFIIKMTIFPMIESMFVLPFTIQTRCFLIVIQTSYFLIMSNSKQLSVLEDIWEGCSKKEIGKSWSFAWMWERKPKV